MHNELAQDSKNIWRLGTSLLPSTEALLFSLLFTSGTSRPGAKAAPTAGGDLMETVGGQRSARIGDVALVVKGARAVQKEKENIQVYCRVRPLIPREIAWGATNAVQFPSTSQVQVKTTVGGSDIDRTMDFDGVFPPATSEETIFAETAHVVDEALWGRNGTVIGYGQTSTGKTHTLLSTMTGSEGIASRAFARIFRTIARRKPVDKTTVFFSALEVYNEQLVDLNRSHTATTDLKICPNGPNGGMYVQGLQEVVIDSKAEAEKAMAAATTNRMVRLTTMNGSSSRGHVVFMVRLETVNTQTQERWKGNFTLVDLAGSERLSKTGACGQAIKEAVSINMSLTSLGQVVCALAEQQRSKKAGQHIPYRNSKLTYLLKDCAFGENCKTVLLCCLSPADQNAQESLCTLQFGRRVRGLDARPRSAAKKKD